MQTALKIVNFREVDNWFVDYCHQWCHLFMLMHLGAAVAFCFLCLPLPPCPPLYPHPLSCSPQGLHALYFMGGTVLLRGGRGQELRFHLRLVVGTVVLHYHGVIHCFKSNFLLVSGIKLYKKMSWS